MKFATHIAAVLAVQWAGFGAAFAAPDPANAQAPVPPIQYRSPFRDYRPLGDDKLLSWKASNDEVAKIGGWRVYAKEAREPQAAAPVPEPTKPAPDALKPSAPVPAAPVHAGHGQPK